MAAPVVKMTMNTAEFNRVLELVNEKSSRTYPEFINGQAYRLALDAFLSTERADKTAIAVALGRTGSRFRSKKGRRLKSPKAIYASAASLDLYRIINWRRKKSGLKPLSGAEMSRVARKMRGAILRSSSFIASGWLYAVNGLKKITREAKSQSAAEKARMSGKAKGWVHPASFAISSIVTCEIGNSALIALSAKRTGERIGRPMMIAERGLAVARNLTAKNMLKHLADKLAPVFKQFSAA